MIEKQLGEKTEILTVDLVHVAVHFEDGERATPINLRRRRMRPSALFHMPQQNVPAFHVLKAKFTQKQLWQPSIFLRIR